VSKVVLDSMLAADSKLKIHRAKTADDGKGKKKASSFRIQ
jgi:hypothetical protein